MKAYWESLKSKLNSSCKGTPNYMPSFSYQILTPDLNSSKKKEGKEGGVEGVRIPLPVENSSRNPNVEEYLLVWISAG